MSLLFIGPTVALMLAYRWPGGALPLPQDPGVESYYWSGRRTPPHTQGGGGGEGVATLCLRHQMLQQLFHHLNLRNRSRGSHAHQQSSEQILHLIRSRLRLGDRRHPYLLDDVVRVTNYIGRINRFRTRLTDPSNLWVCVALPDSASVHNISDTSFWRYTTYATHNYCVPL